MCTLPAFARCFRTRRSRWGPTRLRLVREKRKRNEKGKSATLSVIDGEVLFFKVHLGKKKVPLRGHAKRFNREGAFFFSFSSTFVFTHSISPLLSSECTKESREEKSPRDPSRRRGGPCFSARRATCLARRQRGREKAKKARGGAGRHSPVARGLYDLQEKKKESDSAAQRRRPREKTGARAGKRVILKVTADVIINSRKNLVQKWM